LWCGAAWRHPQKMPVGSRSTSSSSSSTGRPPGRSRYCRQRRFRSGQYKFHAGSSRCTEAERRGSGSTPVRGLAATADVPRRSSPVLRRHHTRLATRRAVDPAPVAGTRSGRGRCRAQAASPVRSAQCGSVRPHWVGSDALFTSRLLLWFCASPFHGGECGFSCGVTVAGRCSRRAGDSGSSPGGRPGRRCWRGMIFRLAPGVGMVGAGYEVAWTAADRS